MHPVEISDQPLQLGDGDESIFLSMQTSEVCNWETLEKVKDRLQGKSEKLFTKLLDGDNGGFSVTELKRKIAEDDPNKDVETLTFDLNVGNFFISPEIDVKIVGEELKFSLNLREMSLDELLEEGYLKVIEFQTIDLPEATSEWYS
jgi:hypothetical protein